jgi:hypothetical protein
MNTLPSCKRCLGKTSTLVIDLLFFELKLWIRHQCSLGKQERDLHFVYSLQRDEGSRDRWSVRGNGNYSHVHTANDPYAWRMAPSLFGECYHGSQDSQTHVYFPNRYFKRSQKDFNWYYHSLLNLIYTDLVSTKEGVFELRNKLRNNFMPLTTEHSLGQNILNLLRLLIRWGPDKLSACFKSFYKTIIGNFKTLI